MPRLWATATMMSRMERQLEADLFGTSNTPEEVGGFGYFRSLTESLSPRDAMYYGRLIKVRDLLRQKRYTGDQETRQPLRTAAPPHRRRFTVI